MTTDQVPAADDEAGEDRVSWLELFFDLVAVAAIAVLTEGLREEPTWLGLGFFLLLFGAIWLSWITVVLYANVAAERAAVTTMIIATFLFAVMAAASPHHFEERANAFAVAFLGVRALVSRASMQTGKLLTSWPLLQLGGVSVLWIVALWIDAPAKFWLWAAALALDFALVVARGDEDGAATVDQFNDRMRRRIAGRRSTQRSESRGAETMSEFTATDVNREHLDERLGTFIIIVLGEAVMGLVLAAATTEWTHPFVRTALLSFAVLVAIWWLTFSYGFSAAPHTRLATLPPRFGLPLHLVTAASVVCIAAGLDEFAQHPAEDAEVAFAWLTCGGVATWFLVSAIGAISAGAPTRWLLGWALPCTAAPLILAPFAEHLRPTWFVLIILLIVGWQVLYSLSAAGRAGGRAERRRPHRRQPDRRRSEPA